MSPDDEPTEAELDQALADCAADDAATIERRKAGRPISTGRTRTHGGQAVYVMLSQEERGELEADAGEQSAAAHLRDTWLRTRTAIAWITDQIAECDRYTATHSGKAAETATTQRRTLEAVLLRLRGDAAIREARRRGRDA